MRKLLLTSSALGVLLLAGHAQAADLPSRAAPVSPIPTIVAFNWTGFYVGINGGYHLAGSNSIGVTPDAGILGPLNVVNGILPASLSPDRDGFTVGGTIGYNYQIGPSFVVGLEADLNYVDGKDTATFTAGALQPNSYALSHGFEWYSTIRGRLGFLPADRLLVYATGGVIIADVSRSATHSNGALGVFTTTSKSDVEAGFTIGAGAEYAITNNLTFKGEYLYYRFADKTLTLSYPGGGTAANTFETDGHIVRAGLNYKF